MVSRGVLVALPSRLVVLGVILLALKSKEGVAFLLSIKKLRVTVLNVVIVS